MSAASDHGDAGETDATGSGHGDGAVIRAVAGEDGGGVEVGAEDGAAEATPGDMIAMEELVEECRKAVVAPNTASGYRGPQAEFIMWLQKEAPDICSPGFGAIRAGGQVHKAQVKRLLVQADMNNPPLDFSKLTAKHVITWMLTRGDSQQYGKGSFGNWRSAVSNLWRTYQRIPPAMYQHSLADMFRGLLRKHARTVGDQGGRLKEGKDPMSFSFYSWLCAFAMKLPGAQHVFGRAFMILTWNLMSRAGNTSSIHINHIEWVEDALVIRFAHSKRDQEGAERHPRHIYANPFRPWACPVLALAQYLACFPSLLLEPDGGFLFPGSTSQTKRFGDWLKSLLEMEEVATEKLHQGMGQFDLSTHSLRKGSSTYCANGTTNSAPYTAIANRAGWSLGNVKERYLRYAGGGDMHVGRMVSGLTPSSREFVTLPPYFTSRTDAVLRAISLAYPGIPDNMRGVGEYCVASLVYHSEYLRATLPPAHRLLSSPLFCDNELVSELRGLVTCTPPRSDAPIQATGIPRDLMRSEENRADVQELRRTIGLLNEKLDRIAAGIPDEVVQKVDQLLEERTVQANQLTRQGARELLTAELSAERAVTTHEIQALRGTIESLMERLDGASGTEPATAPSEVPVQAWDAVEGEFVLPSGDIYLLWHRWWCADTARGSPPLRLLPSHLLSTRNEQKKFSALRCYMKCMAHELKDDWGDEVVIDEFGTPQGVVTAEQVRVPIEAFIRTVPVGKKRRAQSSWTTTVKEWRQRGSPKRLRVAHQDE